MCVVCFYVYALAFFFIFQNTKTAKACWLNIKKTKFPHILFVTSAGIFSNVSLLAEMETSAAVVASLIHSCIPWAVLLFPPYTCLSHPLDLEKKRGLNNLPVIWSYASFLAFFSSIFAVFILHGFSSLQFLHSVGLAIFHSLHHPTSIF